MPGIPDYQTLMLPVLSLAAEGETTIPKVVERISSDFGLTPDQMAELLPSGRIQLINNRAHWAKTYLAKAGLLEQPRRGVFKATARGVDVLRRNLKRIDNTILAEFEEFRAFAKTKLTASGELPSSSPTMPAAAVLQLDSSPTIAPRTRGSTARRRNWKLTCGTTFSTASSPSNPKPPEPCSSSGL